MAKSKKTVVNKAATKTTSEEKVAIKSVTKPVTAKKAPIGAAAKSIAKSQIKTVAKSPSKSKSAAVATQISPAERMKMIAEAAYYLAEARGFSQGNDVNDWVVAEQQVNAKLKS